MTRRDMCHFTGKRAALLNPAAAASAWNKFSQRVEAMGDLDVPKFIDVLRAFRTSTIEGIQEAKAIRCVGLVTEPYDETHTTKR